MTDLSEYARHADALRSNWRTAGGGTGPVNIHGGTARIALEALRFRANASEEVIARALCLYAGDKPDGKRIYSVQFHIDGKKREPGGQTHTETRPVTGKENWTYYLPQARAVLAALEKPATTPVT